MSNNFEAFTKAKKNPSLFASFLSIFVSIILTILSIFLSKWGTLQILMIIQIGLLIFFTVLTYYVISRSNENNSDLIMELNDGFKKIHETEIFYKLEEAVKGAKRHISIIGDGYTDLSLERHQNLIEKYLNTIEEKCYGSKGFQYRRLTTRNIKPDSRMHDHLKIVVGKANLKFQVSFLPVYEYAYTYLVIDDDFLVIHIQSDNKDDYEANYLCLNKDIIKDYNYHFNEIWKKSEPVKSLIELDFELKTGKDIWYLFSDVYKYIPKHYSSELHPLLIEDLINLKEVCRDPKRQLKEHGELLQLTRLLIDVFKSARNLKDGSLIKEFVEIEINLLNYKVSNLSNGYLTIPHEDERENLGMFRVLRSFLLNLGADDSYETLSLDHFWNSITNAQRIAFMRLNKQKLAEGLQIKRYLIIRKNNLICDNGTLKISYIEQIKEHLDLKKKHKNYTFDFCILNEDEYHEQKWNTVSIVKGKEKVFLKFWHNLEAPLSQREIYSDIYSSIDEVRLNGILETFNENMDLIEGWCAEHRDKPDSIYNQIISRIATS